MSVTFRRFAAGFGLGVVVLPLTALFTALVGGSMTTASVAFVALVAGALSLRPMSGDRVAGMACGLVATLVAAVGVFFAMVASGPIG
jgi:hypothetical protein